MTLQFLSIDQYPRRIDQLLSISMHQLTLFSTVIWWSSSHKLVAK